MNTKSKLALSLGLFALPFALFAKSPESTYIESYHGRTDIPVPVSVVTPDIAPQYAGQKVILAFVVDTTGTPVHIVLAKPVADAELVATVTSAIAQWHFAPALVNGKPVARKVVLPVDIVDDLDSSTRLAMQ